MTRMRLPDTYESKTHKVDIEDISGTFELYIRSGYYPDGKLGEVRINISKQGTTLQGMLDSWAKMVSLALQYGMPLESIAEKFIGESYPPSGLTSDGLNCTSLTDYVMRYLMSDKLHGVSKRR